MPKRIRANVKVLANSADIRHEQRNGRDVIIVPSATLPDNVVMNNIKYPAEEIEKSYQTLERTPAPLGHPVLNGEMVSASDPEAINIFGIGAFNTNVRRENGRVLIDKVIDVQRANETDGGRKVIEAINAGDPIHTSTGLIGVIQNEDGQAVIRDMVFDHDAILLNEQGAATPEQGVGMLVNAESGEAEEIEVHNLFLEVGSSSEMDLEALVKDALFEKAGGKPWLKAKLSGAKEFFGRLVEDLPWKTPTTPPTEEGFDTVTPEELKALVGNQVEEAVATAVEPLQNELADTKAALAEMKANAEAAATAAADAAEAERSALANKAVEAGVLNESEAAEATTLVLNALLANSDKSATGAATKTTNSDHGLEDYDMNEALGDK